MTMAIPKKLLEILVCPENHTALQPASPEILQRLNTFSKNGTLKNRRGDRIESEIREGLVREDGQVLYLVRDGIPIMLIDEAINLSILT